MSIECPKCNTHMGMKEIRGKRPGWECLGCGIFFAKQTWKVESGVLVRKYPKPKKRSKTYVDWGKTKGKMPYSTSRSTVSADDSDDIAEMIDEGWV